MAMVSTQPLTEINTWNRLGVKRGLRVRLTTSSLSVSLLSTTRDSLDVSYSRASVAYYSDIFTFLLTHFLTCFEEKPGGRDLSLWFILCSSCSQKQVPWQSIGPILYFYLIVYEEGSKGFAKSVTLCTWRLRNILTQNNVSDD
jgi:hypothetical protein